MKCIFFFTVTLFALSGFAYAEEYRFGVEGQLTAISNQNPDLIDCSLVTPPIPYQVCYSIEADAPDLNPDTAVGLYEPTKVTVQVGDCRFISDWQLYEISNEGPNGDEIYLGAGQPISETHHWQIAVGAWGTFDFVTSDDIPPIAPDLTLAHSNVFKFDILPDIETEGALDTWVRDAPFCETTGTLIISLISDVIAMELPVGISSSLEGKLTAVIEILTNPDFPSLNPAVKQLESFIQRIESMSGKKISETDADYLILKAKEIIGTI